MRVFDPFDHDALRRQIALQERAAWDLESDIPWHLGVDLDKPFLPLDDNALMFPHASAEQRLVLSQWLGLVINSAVSELENAMPRMRDKVWTDLLDECPVNPEFRYLGELFFAEEAKHSRAFDRFIETFSDAVNIEPSDLYPLLPRAFNSFFQSVMIRNAVSGGYAFWWLVALVEDVSVQMYRQIHRNRKRIDPLFYELHRRHLEEEIRHDNYSFMVLKVISDRHPKRWSTLKRRTDFMLAHLAGAPWVASELAKVLKTRRLANHHEFFATLSSCADQLTAIPKWQLPARLYFSVPYVSWFLNPAARKHLDFAREHGSWVPPLRPPLTYTLRI